MRAIFAWSIANLMPIQLRGPQPNGMWASCGRFSLASAVNLYLLALGHSGCSLCKRDIILYVQIENQGGDVLDEHRLGLLGYL